MILQPRERISSRSARGREVLWKKRPQGLVISWLKQKVAQRWRICRGRGRASVGGGTTREEQ